MAKELEPKTLGELNNISLSVAETYEAMFNFLEQQWILRGKPDDTLPSLLGAAHWPNGNIVDPAIWSDWLGAINSVRENKRKF